jgi:hypothetical protein
MRVHSRAIAHLEAAHSYTGSARSTSSCLPVQLLARCSTHILQGRWRCTCLARCSTHILQGDGAAPAVAQWLAARHTSFRGMALHLPSPSGSLLDTHPSGGWRCTCRRPVARCSTHILQRDGAAPAVAQWLAARHTSFRGMALHLPPPTCLHSPMQSFDLYRTIYINACMYKCICICSNNIQGLHILTCHPHTFFFFPPLRLFVTIFGTAVVPQPVALVHQCHQVV